MLEFRALKDDIRHCQRCPLAKLHNGPVPPRVTPSYWDAPLRTMLVGEAPGKTEDTVGRPFVGRAGRLLDTWLDYWGINDHYVANTVNCYPEGVPPDNLAIASCHAWLERNIQVANPHVIIGLGKVAKAALTTCKIGDDVTVLHMKHPAFYLRRGCVGWMGEASSIKFILDELRESNA